MSLTADEVTKIAHLARLGIDPGDIESYAKDLSSIMAMMTRMGELPTAGVPAMNNPLDMDQKLREDIVTESDQRESFQAIAPQVENGLYLVPKVLD